MAYMKGTLVAIGMVVSIVVVMGGFIFMMAKEGAKNNLDNEIRPLPTMTETTTSTPTQEVTFPEPLLKDGESDIVEEIELP